ncbi:MAG: hypothetical protein GTN93_00955 [Anaerolineae bacterium]|nr:hypothetical protein [Anaerolineae bacterium]
MAKIAYADPPYMGCAHLYKGHPDYKGEVNYLELTARLAHEYDGFILHASSTSLYVLEHMLRPVCMNYRVMPWVKPFCAFKRNVSVAYAWEPVIVRPCRKPVVTGRCVMRDFISCGITLKKGLVGAKPPTVIRWAFEMVGAQPGDELHDMYPGTGIVAKTWEEWSAEVVEC